MFHKTALFCGISMSCATFTLQMASAEPEHMHMPIMAADAWTCTQGWNGSYSHDGEAAWDFATSAAATIGYPILAPSSGVVVFADRALRRDGSRSSYGNVVLVQTPVGAYRREAHLSGRNPQRRDGCCGASCRLLRRNWRDGQSVESAHPYQYADKL